LNAVPSALRLGFAGTPPFAVAALDALVESRHPLVAVFTQPDRPAGRGQAFKGSPVKLRADALGIPVHQPVSFKAADAQELLRGLGLDALVVVAYGLILPSAALAAPRLGCFNIHASLLPRWRGAAPIHRALLAGDTTTGVTIMRMDAGLDTGPVLAMRQVSIAATDTTGSLHDVLARVGGELIVETLDAIAAGDDHEEPQPSAGATYAGKINKAEAMIDWAEDAVQIARRVRAFNPWPIAETTLDGVQLRVWEAEVVPGAAGVACPCEPGGEVATGTVLAAGSAGIDVSCGRGVVRLLRVQLAGRKPLSAREFVKAQPLTGVRLASR
jgi:methionyl-tRNA formyltransferase